MTPAPSQVLSNPRKQIGPSLWLFLHLLQFVPAEWTGAEPVWIAGGNVFSDAALAEALEVSLAVISSWRTRLRKLGMLGWLVSPGKGRAFWVSGVNRVFSNGENSASQEAANPVPAVPAGPTARSSEAYTELKTGLVN